MEKNVLVVDDSMFIYEELKYMLADTPFQIIGHAKSGEDAVDLYENLKPDLITMDIVLPGMDGLEAAGIILKEHADAKIIMISSLAYDDTIEEAKKIGTKGFIFKPIERDVLMGVLKDCFGDIQTDI